MAEFSGELRAGTIFCGLRPVSYTVRESSRTRWLGLRIRPDTGLVVTAPPDAPDGRVARFLRQHETWIMRQLDHLAALRRQIPVRWPYGQTLPYRGEEHRVLMCPGATSAGVLRTPDRALQVFLRRARLTSAQRLLKRWYRGEAQRWCLERAGFFGRLLGVGWRRLVIRDQRWCWGSCSARGALSFNYRLVMMSPRVLDYVVLHELAHLRELNHSARFWAIIAVHDPAYREAIAWLKLHGPYLHV